jgi:stage V sporulation protein B
LTKQSFLRGTLILVGAGFVTKVLGFVYRIVLSRIIGDEGMGLFQMAYPILLFAITLTTAGLPVAISKLVSEAEATGDERRIRNLLIVSTVIVTITGFLFTALTILLAPVIANTLLTDERAVYPLLGIAPIIPIVAVASIFRGYFQGRQRMSPYAFSQIIEQIIRIFTVLILAQVLLPYGVEYASAGAMVGIICGEFAGLMMLIRSYRKDPKRPVLKLRGRIAREKAALFRRFESTLHPLLRISVPVTASRLFGSLAYAVEPIVVSQSLALAGIGTATATALYGQLEGMAFPLIAFPSFITYALSVSLVPAVSEAAARRMNLLVEHRLNQAIRLSLIVGAPCAALMYVLAEPLSLLLYNEAGVARMMKILAPFAIFLYLQGPLASVLQGLDRAKESMRNSIFGTVIKTGLIFALASHPRLGIDGVALAINCGVIIVTVLHFLTILRIVPFAIHLREWVKLGMAVVWMGAVVHWIYAFHDAPMLPRVLTALTVGGGVYLASLLFLSLIRKEDAVRLPVIGEWLAKLLPR